MLFPGKRTAKAVAAGEVAEEREKKRRMEQKRRKRSRGFTSDFLTGEQIKIH